MVIFEYHKFFLTLIIFLFMGKVIRRDGFFLNKVAAILFISENLINDGISPYCIACDSFISGFPEFTGNGMGTFALLHKFLKNQPNDFRAVLVNKHLSVFDIIT